MKKIEICLAAVLLCIQLSAQVEKGKVLLGATVPIAGGFETMLLGGLQGNSNTAGFNFTSMNDHGDKSNLVSLGLSPRVGYAAMDNLLVSLGVGINSVSTKDEGDDDKFVLSSFSVEPQVRYYFSGEKAVPFVEVGGTLGQRSYKLSSFDDMDSKLNFSAVGAGGGLALFLNPTTSIDIALKFQTGTMKSPEDDDKAQLTTLGVNIGFSWFLK